MISYYASFEIPICMGPLGPKIEPRPTICTGPVPCPGANFRLGPMRGPSGPMFIPELLLTFQESFLCVCIYIYREREWKSLCASACSIQAYESWGFAPGHVSAGHRSSSVRYCRRLLAPDMLCRWKRTMYTARACMHWNSLNMGSTI